MPYFIDVILPIPLEQMFTYRITEEEAAVLVPGMRVAVPFGKSKLYTGLVGKVHQNAPGLYEAKQIHQLLDKQPMVTADQLRHWQWIAQYYMCSLGEVYRAAIPASLLLESETLIELSASLQIADSELSDDEFLIYEALQYQSQLKIDEVRSILDKKRILPVIKKLLDKGVITVREEVFEQYKPKLVKYVKLHDDFLSESAMHELLDTLSRAPKQRLVVLHMFSLAAKTKKPVKLKDLERESGVSAAVIKSLISKGILSEYLIQTDRIVMEGTEKRPVRELDTHQWEAYKAVKNHFLSKEVVLLHGVTSSGKTEIYVKLIEEYIRQGGQVLYLLPEIALTTQLIARLRQYFEGQIGVYHSRYSQNERVEVWNNVREGKPKAQIIIGARSAMFLPFRRLDLVIIDEEHEPTFKQYDPAPRYHARDAAIVLAHLFSAKVLLGSATPAVESYHNTIQSKYGLVSLSRRYGNVLMPDIELVDIREKYRKKRMTGHFSDRLLEEIRLALEEGFQVMLFQNRRGYAPIVECTTCGHSPQCPNCDVSLTYHRFKNQLRCHYCGHYAAVPSSCWACKSSTLDTKGFGTEQIEEELKDLFPDYAIGRMDMDTTRGKFGHEKILEAFEQKEIDVLVGTQMLTKGLDFRNVKLVGVMNADNLLNFPDFRAHERTFQLLQQVSGRAGRTKERGKVIIQTYNPYHQILQQVSTHDYVAMYKDQINERRQYHYPPVNRIIKITFKHKDFNKLSEGAAWFTKSLQQLFAENVLGPVIPPVGRIRNMYIKNVLVKIPASRSLKHSKHSIKKIQKSFEAIPKFKSIRVIYHVDYL